MALIYCINIKSPSSLNMHWVNLTHFDELCLL